MRKHTLTALLAIVLLVTAATFSVFLYLRAQTPAHILAVKREKMGMLRYNDMIRLTEIQDKIKLTRTISDEDLGWALNLLKSGPILKTEDNELLLPTTISLYLTGARSSSDAQRGKVLQAFTPLLKSQDKYVKMAALHNLAQFRVRASAKKIAVLLSDPDTDVRTRAKDALLKIN